MIKDKVIKFKREYEKYSPIITVHGAFYKLPKDAKNVVLSSVRTFLKIESKKLK